MSLSANQSQCKTQKGVFYEQTCFDYSAALAQIVGLIMFGLLIIGFSKAFKTLAYYSDGHFKDRYLLEVLNELEYAED